MISFTNKGDFKKTEELLKGFKKKNVKEILNRYGKRGVDELSRNTPMDSGKTASSWGYEIHTSRNGYSLSWTNSNLNDGVPIAILIQYGHGTRNGAYVSGIDYINPVMSKVFKEMADEVWREVVGR